MLGIGAVAVIAAAAFFLVLGSDERTGVDASGAHPGSSDVAHLDSPTESTGSEPGEPGEPDGQDGQDGQDQAASATFACSEADPGSWHPADTEADLPGAVRNGTAPGPDGQAVGPPAYQADFPTADAFLASSNVPDVEARRQVMTAGGYHDGVEADFSPDAPFKMQVLSFRDADAATSYMTARLPNVCVLRGTDQLTPLGDEGFAFIDGMGAVHGEFLLGGNQVSLTLCACTPNAGVADIVSWYQHWIDGLAENRTSTSTPAT